jgi:hypothetical protein
MRWDLEIEVSMKSILTYQTATDSTGSSIFEQWIPLPCNGKTGFMSVIKFDIV